MSKMKELVTTLGSRQINTTKTTEALERAELGLEGEVVVHEVTNHFLKLTILWRNLEIQLIAPQERFPQLLHLAVAGVLLGKRGGALFSDIR